MATAPCGAGSEVGYISVVSGARALVPSLSHVRDPRRCFHESETGVVRARAPCAQLLSCMLARLRNADTIAVSDWEQLRSHDRLIYSTGADVQQYVRILRRGCPPHIGGLAFVRAKVAQLMSERHAASVALLARS